MRDVLFFQQAAGPVVWPAMESLPPRFVVEGAPADTTACHMRRRLGLIWKQLGVIVALILVLVPGTGQAATVSIITVDHRIVADGSSFPIDINVVGAVDLISWQFDLAYDPTILRANLITEGPFLARFGTNLFPPTTFTPGVIDNTTGLISLTANSFSDLLPNPNGDGVLATVQFTALRQGFSTVEARNTFLFSLDPDNRFSVANGSVTVVPLPGTAVLMGFGILLLWGLGRWRSQTWATK